MFRHAFMRRVLAPGLVLSSLAVAPAGAEAGVLVYKPIVKQGSTAVFHVGSLSPSRVERARVRSHRGLHFLSRFAVRRALRGNGLVRARVPRSGGRVRLLVYAAKKRPFSKPATKPKLRPTTTTTTSTTTTTTTTSGTSTPPLTPESSLPTGCGATTWGSFRSPTSIPGACWRPYGDASPFNHRLPANPRTLPDSERIASTVAGWGKPEDLYAGAGGTTSDWAHPTYYSAATDPVYTVHCTRSWGECEVEGMQVRIPAAAQPAAAGDGHLTVVDQAGNWEYDFWQVQDKPAGGGTLVVSWGGRTAIGTPDADGLGSDATASHFGLLAGLIRGPELAAGEINHALFMVVKCDNGEIAYPAAGHGSKCSDGSAGPAQGARFMLDMSDAEIAALPVSRWKKAILTAMAHYGTFVGDTGGQSWGLMIESGATYTSFGLPDPAAEFGATQSDVSAYNGKYYFPLDMGVDWAKRLKVVDPCVTEKTC